MIDFLLKHFSSVQELDVLQHLKDSGDQGVSLTDLNRHLRSNRSLLSERLNSMWERGFVEREQQGTETIYRYSPQGPEVSQKLEQVLAAYRERRVSITEAIYSKPMERIRSFSDAFRLRRDKEDKEDG